MLRKARGLLGFGGSWRRLLVGCGVTLVVTGACAGGDEKPPAGDGGSIQKGGTGAFGGKGGTGGRTGGTGGSMGGEGGDGDVDPLAPRVTIVSPDHLAHPDDGAVLVDQTVTVVCEVTQSPEDGSEPVDRGRVAIKMIGPDSEELGDVQETDIDEFSTEFVLTEIPNGAVSFECSASDTSPTPRTGSDRNSTFVDHGPAIEVIEPVEDSAHALLSPVSFAFTVMPDPLVDDDPNAEVGRVTLSVEGLDVDLDEPAPGEYQASVNFADPVLFPDPPPSVHVVITARNIRRPRGERVYDYFFSLDNQGPTITVVSPQEEDVVGGEVVLRFTVTDEASEVDDSSVFVTFNNGPPNRFDTTLGWTQNGDEFSYRFDTTEIVGSTAQVTLNIEAKDAAGNDADGESLLLYLDNVPPIVDLDPPMVREYVESAGTTHCSNAFDPVGPAAASDLRVVSDAPIDSPIIRALVWERTNPAPFKHHSGVDRESVFIFYQPDPQSPLLIDTNDDGECDEVNMDLAFNHLNAVTPEGDSFYGADMNEPPGAPVFPAGCTYREDAMAPTARCTPPSSDLTRVLSWDYDNTVPVVYAAGSLVNPFCTGIDWDIRTLAGTEEGWVCIAARAVDNAGNVGVSRPLRLCYDDGMGPSPCTGAPPECTTACTVSAENWFPPNQVLFDP